MAAIRHLHARGIPVVLALCAGWPLAARADDAPNELPTVTVIGERSELQDSGVVIRVPVAPLGASSLADLLAALPGVQVRSSGGLGSYSEASLRGSSGRQVRVLLDGLPLDTGGGDATSLSLVSPLLLDRVDVYEGRVPVALGSGLAGTINLRTRRALAAPVVYAGSVGSFGARQYDVAAQLGDDVQLALGGQAADNDFHFVNKFKPFDPDDPDRTDSERRQNAATSQYYGLLRYRGPLEITAHVVDDMQQLPDHANSHSADAQLDTHSYALSLSTPEEALWQAALSHRVTREDYRDPHSQIGLGAQETQSDTRRTLLSVGRRFEQLQDSLSSEYIDYSADDHIASVPTASARRFGIRNGVAAQIGDLRRYNASLITGWSRDGSAGRQDDRWQLEPAIGASQQFDSCLAAINLGRRQRLPTFFERYGDRGLFKGNPALDPETANYGDLGVRCRPGEHLQRLELTLFGQDLHDAISPTYDAQGVGHSINTSHALIYGAELDSAGSVAGFGWQLGGTWQHTEDRSDVRATRGRQLPGRFETQINARIERAWRGLIFHYAFRFEAGAYYDSPNLLKTPAMQRHDLGVRGALGALGWSLQALNLGDQHSEQFNGYPTPGRQWLLSLSYPGSAAGAADSTPPEPPTEGTYR
ncbi:TonB-dependent receptor plug domain-containing protein [Solimonas terrae]|uniref:TonB-dependent receptor n=1 Tax=Solimonas terrae TaxID=1396819 RepID=A0A6M2BV43_9GAMM|nr:TonB-dependent receptor [Solimonas terrae]